MARTGTSVYPAALDSFDRIGTSNYEDEVGYEIVHIENEAMDAIEKMQAVIGTTSGTALLANAVTLTGTQTMTNKTINGAIIGTSAITGGTINNATFGTSAYSGGTITSASIITPTGDVATLTGTQTFTNKRNTKRVTTGTTAGTHTIDANASDMFTVTAQNGTAVFASPSGTPTVGQTLIMRIKDNGTAAALSFGTIYNFSSDLVAPTTTIASKTLYMGFVWNEVSSKWECLAVLNNFT